MRGWAWLYLRRYLCHLSSSRGPKLKWWMTWDMLTWRASKEVSPSKEKRRIPGTRRPETCPTRVHPFIL